MKNIVTKEQAQERVNKLGRNITILEWNGTTKLCKYMCNNCGLEHQVKEGNYTYSDWRNYWRECKCDRYRGVYEYYQSIKIEGKIIDEQIHIVKEMIKKYEGKEVIANDIVEEITEFLDIGNMTQKRFEFSILERVCDFEKIVQEKCKVRYYVKTVYSELLPKTKERIELDQKANKEYRYHKIKE